jgi:peptidoglycan/xylan/chitin deacetylase (PgdA/CDA1 family)
VTLLHRPDVQRWLGGHVLCRVTDAGPRFALTFDDGPSPRNTPRLLDVLARSGARATFFLIADRARRHRELVRRIVAEGHEVGIHGSLHVPPWLLPRALLLRDLDEAARAVREACGRTARHYRAPFGLVFPRQAAWVRAYGLTPVLGSIYPRDHSLRDAATIARRVLERLEPGSIVILHDSSALADPDRSPTLGAVEAILEAAAARALRSVAVAELVDLQAGASRSAAAT